MKKIALAALTLTTLAACASNQDPMSPLRAAAAQQANGQKAEGKNISVDDKKPADEACPELNGKYVRAENPRALFIETKKEGAAYSYRMSDRQESLPDFLRADGKDQTMEILGEKITVAVSCNATSITLMVKDKEHAGATETYTVQGDQIVVSGIGEGTETDAGTYVKQ
jgi:hypothetical protein